MTTPDRWRKSSYSDGGDGDDCVEIANSPTHTAIRDSKAPTARTLTFQASAYTPFIDSLSRTHPPARPGGLGASPGTPKAPPLESDGAFGYCITWELWRWRESNPRPTVRNQGFSVCSSLCFSRPRQSREQVADGPSHC